jgi:hypothetical protein
VESKGWRGGVLALQAERPARENWKAIMEREREAALPRRAMENTTSCPCSYDFIFLFFFSFQCSFLLDACLVCFLDGHGVTSPYDRLGD